MGGRHTVLIVDDHRPLAENLAEILEESGFDAVVLDSAEAAIQGRDVRARADLIVTDFKLPGLNGSDLIRTLRSEGVRTPALVISAYTDEKILEDVRAAGVAAFLPKPVDIPTFLQQVHALTAVS